MKLNPIILSLYKDDMVISLILTRTKLILNGETNYVDILIRQNQRRKQDE